MDTGVHHPADRVSRMGRHAGKHWQSRACGHSEKRDDIGQVQVAVLEVQSEPVDAARLITARLITARRMIARRSTACLVVAVGRAAEGKSTERGLQAVRGQEAHPEPAPGARETIDGSGTQSGDQIGGSHVPTISRSVETWRTAAHDAST
ncbi:MAG TPA: hypothetical protein VIG79_01450 [Lapillicoccus sp.]|uniref:hypothetical protein n=1 Tax=Lapillicoccus sp. TaxID=1909287 RepID=UPI002F9474B0